MNKRKLEEIEKEKVRISVLEIRLKELTSETNTIGKLTVDNGRRINKLNNSLFSNNITGILVVLDIVLLTGFGIYAYIKAK